MYRLNFTRLHGKYQQSRGFHGVSMATSSSQMVSMATISSQMVSMATISRPGVSIANLGSHRVFRNCTCRRSVVSSGYSGFLHQKTSSSFHRLDMTLAVAEALNPNKQTNKVVLLCHCYCLKVRNGSGVCRQTQPWVDGWTQDFYVMTSYNE